MLKQAGAWVSAGLGWKQTALCKPHPRNTEPLSPAERSKVVFRQTTALNEKAEPPHLFICNIDSVRVAMLKSCAWKNENLSYNSIAEVSLQEWLHLFCGHILIYLFKRTLLTMRNKCCLSVILQEFGLWYLGLFGTRKDSLWALKSCERAGSEPSLKSESYSYLVFNLAGLTCVAAFVIVTLLPQT